MKRILSGIFFILFLVPSLLNAQKSSEFLPDKPGKWTYSTNIKRPGAEVAAFNKNLAVLAEWFHQNTPILTNPKGFDIEAHSVGIWDDDYKKNLCNYGLRAEIYFNFQHFFSKGGKRIVEPPHYSFYINNTEGGHGTNPNYKYFSEQEYDPSRLKKFSPTQQKAINGAVKKMNGVFSVFPFVKELAPGVNLYDCELGGCATAVVFNPERPDFWLPVTVRELAGMYLEYYTQTKDDFILPYLKKEIERISEEEMNAPVFSGHDERTIFRFSGKEEGLQNMRFNPEYWDKSLPPSAIQFMTFGNAQPSEAAIEEHFRNNGYPSYVEFFIKQINWKELQQVVMPQK